MFVRRLVAVMVLLASLAVLTQPRSPAADAAKLPFPYKEIVLDNGLRVLSLDDPGSGVVAVQLWYHEGPRTSSRGGRASPTCSST